MIFCHNVGKIIAFVKLTSKKSRIKVKNEQKQQILRRLLSKFFDVPVRETCSISP